MYPSTLGWGVIKNKKKWRSGFGVWGSGFIVLGVGFGMQGSEAGSYLRRTGFVYHSTLGLRVIKKKKKFRVYGSGVGIQCCGSWGLRFGVEGLGMRDQSLGCRVQG